MCKNMFGIIEDAFFFFCLSVFLYFNQNKFDIYTLDFRVICFFQEIFFGCSLGWCLWSTKYLMEDLQVYYYKKFNNFDYVTELLQKYKKRKLVFYEWL